MLLNDRQIRTLAEEKEMISPFVGHKVQQEGRKSVISYGLSSYGYDIRVADEYKVFTQNAHNNGVDPKAINSTNFLSHTHAYCWIPPNSYALCRSLEYFKIPEDVFCIVLGKSTYARSGLIVNATPGEPGWEGEWTLELCNGTSLPIKIYSFEGIAQVLFLRGERPENLYGANGKYQNQRGVVLPKV